MIESPLIQEIVEQSRRDERVKTIALFLESRFGPVPAAIAAGLAQVKESERLDRLTREVAACASLRIFPARSG